MESKNGLKVTSYSIFGYSGRNGNYWAYVPSLLRLHSLLFPDYKLALYHDESLRHMAYGRVLKHLAQEGLVDLYDMGSNEQLCRSMLWRCKAIWDYPTAAAVFFRDIDSCPTYWERCVNEAFVNSGFGVHGINANKAHSIPLLGGLWGCVPAYFVSRTKYTSWDGFEKVQKRTDLSVHGADQLFLRDVVLYRVKSNLLVHKDVPFMDFPEISDDMKNKDADFMPYMGAAGYRRGDVIDYCNEKDSPFITHLKSIEAEYGIDAKTHNYVKLEESGEK